VIGNKITNFAQEFRLQSKAGGPLKWTAGAFYTQGKRDLRQDQPTPGFDARFAAAKNFPGYNSQLNDNAFTPDDYFSGTQNIDSKEAAVFAEATYTVWDKLDLTAGLRLFRGTQDFDLKFSGLFGNLINSTPSKPQSSIRRPAAVARPRKAATRASRRPIDSMKTTPCMRRRARASATAVTISRCRSTSAARMRRRPSSRTACGTSKPVPRTRCSIAV
jgi:hypothetical protein